MSTELSAFLVDVLPSVPGCPQTTAINAVRKAAQHLCSRAMPWRQTLTAIDITLGDDTYTLTAPTDTKIVTATYAEYNGTPIYPKSEEELDEIDYNWRNAGNGTPQYFFMETDTDLRLNRKSNVAITGGLVVKAALQPSDAATSVDDSLFTNELYRKAIANGAKHYLFEIPQKGWSDINLALYHGKFFSSEVSEAKAWVDRGRTRAPQRARMQFFA